MTNKYEQIALDELIKNSPLSKLTTRKGRSAVPFVLPPKIFADPEYREEIASFLGFKAAIEATRMFAKQLMAEGFWTGKSDNALFIGRESLDKLLDAGGTTLASPIEAIIARHDGFEFLVPYGILFAEPGAIDVELDVGIIVKDDTMQLNVWLKFVADPALGRYSSDRETCVKEAPD